MDTTGYILGIDHGTTGTTALLFDQEWKLHARGYREHQQYYPKPGWVEHDPHNLWEQTVAAVGQALRAGGLQASQVRALGLDNQGETVLVWNKRTGKPVYNAIVWQDRRTAREADALQEAWGPRIKEKTGVLVDAYFSALKIKWILDNVEGAAEAARAGDLLAGTTDTWLFWKMTGGRLHMTDYSTASRWMLLNIHTGNWDSEILDRLGIPESMLPELRDSSGMHGETDPSVFLDARIPIVGAAVDQQAALFGQTCFQPGEVKTTYGTGCFMLMNTGDKIVDSAGGLLTTVAWGLNGNMTFALDGGVYITGAAVQWLRDGLRIIETAGETESMARSVPDTAGVYFVPAFVGLAAPYWDQYARGMMIGITAGTSREHIVRATLESIAFQVAENLEVMRSDSGIDIPAMRVDGGAVVNSFLMQFQADLLGIPVDVPVINETTALGSAYLAGLGVGDFKNLDDIKQQWKLERRYEPQMSNDERAERMAGWRRAVERARHWSQD